MSFDQLLTIPEQDEWLYSDGKSTTCVAFILAMYKEAGIFTPFSESIQVTEFTVSDSLCSLSLSLSGWLACITKSFLTCIIWLCFCLRFVTHTCSRFLKTTQQGFQAGATQTRTSFPFARFLESIEWSCQSTTPLNLMRKWTRTVHPYPQHTNDPHAADYEIVFYVSFCSCCACAVAVLLLSWSVNKRHCIYRCLVDDSCYQ